MSNRPKKAEIRFAWEHSEVTTLRRLLSLRLNLSLSDSDSYPLFLVSPFLSLYIHIHIYILITNVHKTYLSVFIFSFYWQNRYQPIFWLKRLLVPMTHLCVALFYYTNIGESQSRGFLVSRSTDLKQPGEAGSSPCTLTTSLVIRISSSSSWNGPSN